MSKTKPKRATATRTGIQSILCDCPIVISGKRCSASDWRLMGKNDFAGHTGLLMRTVYLVSWTIILLGIALYGMVGVTHH
jgi:hypothetical protein